MDDEDHLVAEIARLERELRAANEDHYWLTEQLDAERDKRRRFTRAVADLLRESGLW